jgi:hypothetical protein
MSRYIDADALLAELQEEIDFKTPMYTEEQNMYFTAGLKCAYRDVKHQPTADVVEVVRCNDCKHNPDNGGECDRSITHTSRDYVCEVNTYRYIGLDYCSYGERRSENEG